MACSLGVANLKSASINVFAQIARHKLWDYFEQGHLWEADERKALEFSLLLGQVLWF